MNVEEMLKALGHDWIIDLSTRLTHAWTLTIHPPGEPHGPCVYYGENLKAVVRAAWAGEPQGLVR